MQIIEKDILEDEEILDYICFTANSFIKNNTALVMGAGFAKTIKDKFKDIEFKFGKLISETKDFVKVHRTPYDILKRDFPKFGLVFVDNIGAFQTKYSFTNNSTVELIQFSTEKLKEFAENNPDKTIGLVYPGIGLGRLQEGQVLPILEILPDNVLIYKLPSKSSPFNEDTTIESFDMRYVDKTTGESYGEYEIRKMASEHDVAAKKHLNLGQCVDLLNKNGFQIMKEHMVYM